MSETANAVDLTATAPAQLSDAINRKRIENAHAWFKQWIDTDQRNLTSAARTLEIERSLCSKFYHRKLDSDPTRIVLAIEALRGRLEGPEGIQRFMGFVETRCAKLVFKYASAARDGHAISLLVGSTGCGKTEAIREFQRRTESDGKPRVEYLYCRVTSNLPALINELAERLGIIGRERGGDPAKLHRRIAERLKSRPLFLVFDEADSLGLRQIEFARNLSDECGAGILLIGRPTLLRTIKGGLSWATLGERESDGPLAPFVSRVSFTALPNLSDDEATDITEDVLKAQLNDDAIAALLSYIGGDFRLLSKVIGKLRDIRARAGAWIDKPMIEAAWLRLQHLDVDALKR
jgi:DNA transposition AAA+ family ATPase